MSAIPGSALDIKRRLAAGEPCPICGGMWFDYHGTQHAEACLYAEYEHLRSVSTERINRLATELRAAEDALARARRLERRGWQR